MEKFLGLVKVDVVETKTVLVNCLTQLRNASKIEYKEVDVWKFRWFRRVLVKEKIKPYFQYLIPYIQNYLYHLKNTLNVKGEIYLTPRLLMLLKAVEGGDFEAIEPLYNCLRSEFYGLEDC